ncbi:MAG TPA: hypothetical protein VK816_08200 [Jatrophihabitantaceae bacterium]|jgi:hypothetical protein|nr:hypothetical protein [Jatrophihabitantaceae bacterium]
MQFSLFGAAAAEPSPDDLAGVLLAGGQWVRSAEGARLSVVVADQWRAEALSEAFAQRDVGGDTVPAEGGCGVRTRFSPQLAPAAASWTRGANQGPPAGFALSPGGLRLWVVAAGHADAAGYVLGTAEADGAVHLVGGAQLARLGLAAVSLAARGGPGWRITSAKRLRRLAELLDEPPAGAGQDWPK